MQRIYRARLKLTNHAAGSEWMVQILSNKKDRSCQESHQQHWIVQVLSTERGERGVGNPTSRQCVVRSSPFYRTRHLPRNRESHITAVCGWLKSFLPDETSSEESGIPHHGSVWMVQVLSTERDVFRGIGNPTSRQCVDGSSPFYRTRRPPGNRESHITAVCGWFKSFLPNELFLDSAPLAK